MRGLRVMSGVDIWFEGRKSVRGLVWRSWCLCLLNNATKGGMVAIVRVGGGEV